jgi:hypothetical protein
MICKLISAVLLIGLAGCAAPGDSSSSDASSSGADTALSTSSGPASTCDADPVQSLLGKQPTSALVEGARSRSHSSTARVLKPDQPVTMEYDPSRLNLIVNEKNILSSIHCG